MAHLRECPAPVLSDEILYEIPAENWSAAFCRCPRPDERQLILKRVIAYLGVLVSKNRLFFPMTAVHVSPPTLLVSDRRALRSVLQRKNEPPLLCRRLLGFCEFGLHANFISVSWRFSVINYPR